MSGWPDEHQTMLRQLWDDGVKGQKIADAINRAFGTAYTKNAVIGQKHRLGMQTRQTRTPKHVVKTEPQVRWTHELDMFITELSSRWNKTPSQIAERVNAEYAVSVTGVYVTHSHVFQRLRTLNVDVVKTQKTPKHSNVTGAFGHAPAHFETPPKPVDITQFAKSNVDRMGTNERNSCKWPITDDVRDLQLCGRFVTVGAYCATHGALAYTVKPGRKRTAMISKPQLDHVNKPKAIDIHAHRKALVDDCKIGTCSVNNCLFPSCTEQVPSIVAELPHASEWLNNG